MCGRYTLRQVELIREAMGLEMLASEFDHPRYNIAPGQDNLIIRINAKGERVASAVSWGLIPSWTKGIPKTKPINARSETVTTSGMFRQAFQRRRCLIPADGFYEWQGDKPPKQPYFIHYEDDRIFSFAGIWERWKPDEETEPVDTYTILTTSANALMSPIHQRMPVIIAKEDYDLWLDREASADRVTHLLRPAGVDGWTAQSVSTRVNTFKNDGPELLMQ